MADLNEEQFKGLVSRLGSRLASKKANFLLLAAKRLEGLMKRRIFNKGQDNEGVSIGPYISASWIKKRAEGGRQTKYVDLQNKGDLLRSFTTVRDGDEAVLAIVRDEDYKKATGNSFRRSNKGRGQEIEIFEPSEDELLQVEEYFDDLVNDEIENFFK